MEYTPANATHKASHADMLRLYIQTEANAGEYDVPPAFQDPKYPPIIGYEDWPLNKPTPGTTCTGTCPDGPDCDCIHKIEHHFLIDEIGYDGNTCDKGCRLIYLGPHCHTPSCVRMELYRNDTGTPQLICHQTPTFGTGQDRLDEPGFEFLPPCLFSGDVPDPTEPLDPSFLLPKGTPMIAVKYNRNTYSGHYGEMASWQMRGVNF